MLKILDLFVVPLTAGVFLPSAVLFVEVMASLAKRSSSKSTANTPTPRGPLLVVIPGHNEELSIAATIRGVLAQTRPGDRVVVVADNCTDSTAARAREAGSEVLERTNPTERGKGYAIAYAVEQIKSQPASENAPAVFILLDADCHIGPGTLDSLAHAVQATGEPAQAGYRLSADAASDPRAVLSTFAFALKNIIRPAGLANMGVSIPLTGSGMAFPWALAASLPWATGHITEDMKLGAELAERGIRVRPAPGAEVRSAQPNDAKVALAQRTRWEHGHLKVIFDLALPMLVRSLSRGRLRQAFAAIDLMVPPLALLAAMWVGSAVVVAAAYPITRHGLAPILSGLTLVMLVTVLAVAWWKEGRQCGITLTRLAAIPFYVLWKIPMYFRFARGRRQEAWVRTDRSGN